MLSKEAWQGSHYQLTCQPQYQMAQFVLSQLPKRSYGSILDIGCGSGEVTIELAKYADNVLGVDYSKSMIQRAHKSYGKHNDVHFDVYDIRSLDKIPETFDLITAFHTIQWIPSSDQCKAFEQMANRLNPGGICVVLVTDRFNIFYDPLMYITKQKKWQLYLPEHLEPWNWQTVTSISTSFHQAKLRPLQVFVWYKKYHFKSKQAFLDFMANWFYAAQHFTYIPEEKQNELFNETLELFLMSIAYKANEPIEFESPFIIGIAQKNEIR